MAKTASNNKPKPAPWYIEFRIDKDIIQTAQVRYVTSEAARLDLGLRAPKEWDLRGTDYPYFNRDGEIVYHRVRREQHGKKNVGTEHEINYGPKYLGNSADDADRILYGYPGAWERLDDPNTTVVLVEAEKTVLALEAWARRMKRTDLVFLAMGGCFGWKSKKLGILPDMDTCARRIVIVLLDANVHTNDKVREARLGLNAFLFSVGCEVFTADLPQLKDAEDKAVNGPDDVCKLPDGDEILAEVFDKARTAVVAPYSQHALAERFVGENLDNCIYVANVGWYVWDGCRWKFDDECRVELLAQKLCEAAASERRDKAEQIRLRSRATREAILREAQPHLTVSVEKLDKDLMLLNTPGGTVDLRTGKLREARREDFITKITAAAPSTVAPNRWNQFAKEVTADDADYTGYLQRVGGYCLTGDVSEHALFFLHGKGANGKGTFTRALQGILNDYAAVIPTEMLMVSHNQPHPTGIASLRGARMATTSEVEDGSRWAEAELKKITGGDPIKARFMRKDFFEFLPQFKLVILGNHKPQLRNVGEAIKRRFNTLPFPVTFTEDQMDKKLDETLKGEYGGILQWFIDGCVEWQKKGLMPPDVVTSATEGYLDEQDSMGDFLKEHTRKDPNGKVLPMQLYDRYKPYMEARSEYVLPLKFFVPKLSEVGYVSKKSHGVRYITGLRFVTEAEIAAQREVEHGFLSEEEQRVERVAKSVRRSLEVVAGRRAK